MRDQGRRCVDFVGSVPFGITLLILIFIYCWIGSAGFLPITGGFPRQEFEKTEMQWFAWWPFTLLLTMLSVSLILVTVRRIPFRREKMGVWITHLGILILILGSGLYFGLKTEGDVLVPRGETVDQFHINDRFALHTRRTETEPWCEHSLPGLPRYFERLSNPDDAWPVAAPFSDRPLDLVPRNGDECQERVNGDPGLRITGFLPYATLEEGWSPVETGFNPFLRFTARLDGKPTQGSLLALDPDRNRHEDPEVPFGFFFRWVETEDELSDLIHPSPPEILVTVRGNEPLRIPLDRARAGEVGIPGTPYRLRCEKLYPSWQLASPGHREKRVAMAMVRVTGGEKIFTRAVVAPDVELSQDILDDGTPHAEELVDRDIRIELLNVRPGSDVLLIAGPVGTHAILRSASGNVAHRKTELGQPVSFLDGHLRVTIEATGRSARKTTKPRIIPPRERNLQVGMFNSMIQAEVTRGDFRERIWIPYSPYTHSSRLGFFPRTINLPGGDRVELLFSRQTHPLPAPVTLDDFTLEMFPGRTRERDFISQVRFQKEDGQWSEVCEVRSNQPTEFKGWWFFQATWDPPVPEMGYPGLSYTGLGVGNRQGVRIMLLGSFLIVLGSFLAFYMKRFLRGSRPQDQKVAQRKIEAEKAKSKEAKHRSRVPVGVGLALTIILSLALAAWGQVEAPELTSLEQQDSAKEAVQSLIDKIHGSFRFEYRFRSTPNEVDQDLYSSLAVDVGNPELDKFSGSIFGTLATDIDGRSTSPSNASGETLYHVLDTYDDSTHGRLYHAYLDVNRAGSISRLRLGRQELLTGLPAWLDGGSVDVEPLNRTTITLYGGVPVNLYESSAGGDHIYGGQIRSTPLRWDHLGETTIVAEYQRYVDESKDFGKHEDDVVNVRAWQELAEYGDIEGRIFFLEGHLSDWSVTGRGRLPLMDLTLEGHYKRHTLTTRDYSDRYTDYFAILGALERYQEYGLRVYKGLSNRFGVEAGFRSKRLLEQDDQNRSNTDFTRYFAGLDSDDFLVSGLSAGLFFEIWKASQNDEFFVGFDLDYRASELLRLEAGSSYSEFKYETDDLGNLLSLDTRKDRVRDVFVGLKYELNRHRRVRVRYAVERSELDTINTVSVVLVQDF